MVHQTLHEAQMLHDNPQAERTAELSRNANLSPTTVHPKATD
jgi:hypothetical protein